MGIKLQSGGSFYDQEIDLKYVKKSI